MKPKISILVPAWNEQDYIGACLDKLVQFQQQYADQFPIEIIVCDNNSTDATAQVVNSYAPAVTLVTELKKGTNAARQKAFSASSGDIVGLIDADSIPNPNWIDRVLTDFNDPQVISVAGVGEFHNNYRWSWILNSGQKTLYKLGHELSEFLFHDGGILIGQNAWFRRETLEKIGGFDISYEFFGDDARIATQIAAIREPGQKMIYDIHLITQTSPRRFERVGFLKLTYLYTINFIWVKLFQKPYSK